MTLSDFLAMGGYGFYVWVSYGATAVVLALNVLAARHRHRAVRRMLRDLSRLDDSRPE